VQAIYRFSEKYIEPVTDHWAIRSVSPLATEVVKLIAVKVFLGYLGSCYLINSCCSSKKIIYNAIVLAPFQEEFVFRWILLRGMRWTQLNYNHVYTYFSSHSGQSGHMHGVMEFVQRRGNQKLFRIRSTALIFALAHLVGDYPDKLSGGAQFVRSFMGGIVYGHLVEKYDSLAPAILSHGIHNTFTLASRYSPESMKSLLFVCSILNRLVSYLLTKF